MNSKLKKILITILMIIFSVTSILFISRKVNNSSEKENIEVVSRRDPFYSNGTFLSEEGTEIDPYVISSKSNMDELSRQVSEEKKTFKGKVFVVDANVSEIDLGNFVPIGTRTYPFEGIFDGYGTNFILNIDKPALELQGLFGHIRTGLIENVSVSGSITGYDFVGGIVGWQESGTVRNVYNTARIEATRNTAGGIVGYMGQGLLTNAYNRGEIISLDQAGGIVGYAHAAYDTKQNEITNVYSSGTVTSNNSTTTGGVIGLNQSASYNRNVRTNLYYDITVIANYDQSKKYKPSTDPSGQGLNSGIMFSQMSGKFGTGWVFREDSGSYSYYPQLTYFSAHTNKLISSSSMESVIYDTKDGIGTENKPFLLRSITDIEKLKTQLNTGETYKGFYFKIAEGRDYFNLGNFIPIGNNSHPFYGSFDGSNVEFTVNINSEASFQGLFGHFGYGTIKNLSVTGQVIGKDNVGGIVGYKESGTITNVYNKANIKGTNYVGGIVGNHGTGLLTQSYNSGDVTATATRAGGIVGHLNQGTINHTYNRGEIIAEAQAGGIIGYAYAAYDTKQNEITDSYSAGLVSAGQQSVGGVIGTDQTASYNRNTRARLYYDTSILVQYDQPKTYKPSVAIGAQYGLTSAQLLYGGFDLLKMSTGIWHYEPKNGTTAYYPQLLVFANHSKTDISGDSFNSVSYEVGDGLGTKDIPFLIRTKEDMDELSKKVAAGNTFIGYYFKVDDNINEIDLEDFIAIGTRTYPFEGTFDGNSVNFILNIDKPALELQGLFGHIRTGLIENVSVSGSVIGYDYVGGIVGLQESGTVRNVYNTARIEATRNTAGGIVGYMGQGLLTNAYNRGEIISLDQAGGIVGYAHAAYDTKQNEITNVYSSGTVTSNNSTTTGGVIGLNQSASYNRNVRTNLYYDITVIANYDQSKKYKPSTDPSGQGLNSGIMFSQMSGKFGTGWVFKESTKTDAYYPQLAVFSNDSYEPIRVQSEESVKINIEGGLGTEEFPFWIYTIEDIEDLKEKIEKGNTFKGFFFKMDINVTEMDLGNFIPIGNNSHPFYGSFDGSNVEFTVNINSEASFQGLFGHFGYGTIKNLSVTGQVIGKDNVGGIVGYKESGTITNVYNKANIKGTNYVGGIVGNHGTGLLTQSYNSGDVTATATRAGGIVGHLNQGTINHTYNRGEIIAEAQAGGIIGYAYAAYDTKQNEITDSYSAGLVSAGQQSVGGVIGTDQTASYNRNTRARLYYDTSILVQYDQPKTYKPSVAIGAQYGLTSAQLLYGGFDLLKMSTGIWHYEPKNGTTAYYPQLLVFANHSKTDISGDSFNSVSYEVGDGLGTKDIPFLIRTKEDMDELSKKVAAGNTFIGYYFKVDDNINEIDLEDFIAIGTRTYPFEGTFDGNSVNFILNIDKPALELQGLFGHIRTGLIENVSISGSITGYDFVGGIVGWQESGTVRNVYNTARIEATRNTAGGIVGYMGQGLLTNAYNRGEIISLDQAGGIVGYAHAAYDTKQNEITNVYSSGTVTSNNSTTTGGVIGLNQSASYNRNVRTNLYYDITVIANYDQSKKYKPSTDPSGQGLNSGIMFSQMSGKFGTGWVFKESTKTDAYYPQLAVFSNDSYEPIRVQSEESVKINIEGGLGTEEFPFWIYTIEDIEDLKEKIEKGNTFKGFFFKMDINVTEMDLGNFIPIGNNSHPFYGSFDGSNVEFTVNINSEASFQGLFGHFGYGTIKNLSVTGQVIGKDNVGGIVGYKESGTITNVYNKANIKGTNYVGGIVGNHGTGLLTQSYNSGDVTATATRAGGIVGHLNQGTINHTYNRGEIIAEAQAGGIVGYAYAAYDTKQNEITDSYSAGLVSAGQQSVGGVIGTDQSASYNRNTRARLYYDASILINYKPTKPYKPSTAISGQGLDKVSMIENGLLNRGFSSSIWEFRLIEGNYAYYPQLKVFANHESNTVKRDSVLSVRTNPFMGDGTKDSPYLIRTAQDMLNLSNAITNDFDAEDTYYKVAAGAMVFDLTTNGFTGIGSKNTPFKGHFDGSHATFILNINATSNYQGLFGYISQESTVANLAVKGNVRAQEYVGGVIGYNDGTVENVYNVATIEGSQYIGGVIGYNGGSLSMTYNTGHIFASGKYAGGITGYNQGSIENGYSSARVHATQYVGGVTGFNTGSLANLYYNKTMIEFYSPGNGLQKPSFAIGNQQNSDDVTGLGKEEMFNLNTMNFDSTMWTVKNKTGMWDYFPQLTSFASFGSTVTTNSIESVRIIRFASGNGDENSPYIIRNAEDMVVLTEVAKEDSLSGIYFKVLDGVQTIDLTNENEELISKNMTFSPIGSDSRRFKGIFDGNGVTFKINIKGGNFAGLFSVTENATLKNFSTTGQVSGADNSAAVVGYALNTTISNVYNKAVVIATGAHIGGIVGLANKTTAGVTKLNHVYNDASITGRRVVAGIVGNAENGTQISYAYNTGDITATADYAAGIASYLNNGLIHNAYNAATIRGGSIVGGIVGNLAGISAVTNSYYDASIIDADTRTVGVKPVQAINNALDKEDVKGIGKAYLTGETQLSFDRNQWIYIANDGVNAYYPQLKVFAEGKYPSIKEDSYESVKSYIFAGLGTDASPYIIVNEFDMVILSNLVSKGEDFTDVYFRVRDNASEFDMTQPGLSYVPIGTQAIPFNGQFNGSGVNFKLSLQGSKDYQGLFGFTGSQSVIYQLSISGQIEANDYVGSVVGYNQGLVHTVYSTAKINGRDNVGGIIGYNAGDLNNTYYISTLNARNNVGGIIGLNKGTINDGYAVAKISGQSNSTLGGVIGYNEGTAERLYYDKEIADIYKVSNALKPQKAIGNQAETVDVLGLSSAVMHNGKLDSFGFNDTSKWLPLTPYSFEIYYLQLTYFGKHKTKIIVDLSKKSVSAMRFKEGTGLEDDPYIIRNADDMKAVSDLIIARNNLKGIYFKVADEVEEIDLTTLTPNYVPIGNESYKFEGSFDGTFTKFNVNLKIDAWYQGLFGYIGSSGVVKNLYVTGKLEARRFVGGIAGRNWGLIENVYNQATVVAYDYYAGGIVGYNDGTIRNAYNIANIKITNYDHVGGIAGGQARNSLIENVYNTGNIHGRYYVGGLVGYVSGTVQNGYSVGVTTAVGQPGGVLGTADGNAIAKNLYYDMSVMMTSKLSGTKATTAIAGLVDKDDIKGLTTAALSGGYLPDAVFDDGIFKFRSNQAYQAYHPQLTAFADSTLSYIKMDSLDSVERQIFQGDGTEENPYLIISNSDMKALSLIVLQGTDTENIYFKVYKEKLIFDLAIAKLDYLAIGSVITPFKGHFDGNGAIFNLNINKTADYQGLFGYAAENASIKNLTVTGKVTGKNYTAGIVGYNQSILENVINEATITGDTHIAGIAGYNKANIINSYNTGKIQAFGDFVGGLAGVNAGEAIIEYSYNMGNIKSDHANVGGLVGNNLDNGTIRFSFNHGDVTASGNYVGGITAINYGHVQDVYNTGNIETGQGYIAGLVAMNYGDIHTSYAAGHIIGQSYVAGLVVFNYGTVEKLYYDSENVIPQKAQKVFAPVKSAIYQVEDTMDVKSLTLEQMTGLYAIGNNDEQMNISKEYYNLRKGNDFTSYYPEILYFTTKDTTRQEHSKISVRDQRLTGNGTLQDPYLIYDGYDLMTIDEFLLNGNDFTGKHFKVADGVKVIDLTIKDVAFKPIGNDQAFFNAKLNGNGANFIITLDSKDQDYQALFHTLGNQANVNNFSISGTVFGRSYVGAVAGRNYGTIAQVTSSVFIKTFGSNSESGNSVGGITGVNGGTIKNTFNLGIVESIGSFVGGIAGENEGNIQDSYNKGNISGRSMIGGIAGINRGEIIRTYNTANITAQNTYAGGIAGENARLIADSFNDGSIYAESDGAGGIAGLQNVGGSEIHVVYHSGTVRVKESLAGGIIGKMDSGQLFDAYVSGFVNGKHEIGMIIGQLTGGSVTRSYYDINVLKNYKPSVATKPEKAFGNFDKPDTTSVKGLYHGQMIAQDSIGTKSRQMNFYYGGSFKTALSYDKYSFYPQIIGFANSTIELVKNDSLESVRSITFMEGDGTQANPYILTDESDVIALAETVNSGNTYEGVYFRVKPGVTQFDFADETLNYIFTAIGSANKPFEGSLDGSKANFKIKLNENKDYQGLFGYIGTHGHVYNLSVSGQIKGYNYTAGIAGYNLGNIHDVYNQATIDGRDYTGGIAGYHEGKIENVYNKGAVTGYNYTGGIAGMVKNRLAYSYNIGVIYGKDNVGAIAGFLEQDFISYSYFDSRILSAYRDANGYKKPTKAIGNSNQADSVYGLDKNYMIGANALGSGSLQMNLPTTDWATNLNMDPNQNYPQLRVFAAADNAALTKELSKDSTQTTLYKINYDYNGATERNTDMFQYVMFNYHYKSVVPFKFGYELEGWYLVDEDGTRTKYTDKEGLSLSIFSHEEDITLVAHWEIAKHTVSFIDGNNKVVDSLVIEHGGFIELSDVVPSKNPSATKVYFFDSWNFDVTQRIEKDIKIYATYTEKDRYYNITYLNGDGVVIKQEKAEYGKKAVETQIIPTKLYHDDIAYQFIAWDFNFEELIYESKTINPIFKEVDRWYDVTFVNSDGTPLVTRKVEYKTRALEPDQRPTKAMDERYTYVFSGWDKDISEVTENMTVTAQYESKTRYYIVRFIDGNGKVYNMQDVAYGESAATPSGLPRKEHHDLKAYKFIGWDKEYTYVTEDMTVNALFQQIKRYWDVTFVDGNGDIFMIIKDVEYLSESPLPDLIPTKDATNSHVYKFIGWEDTYKQIGENTIVKAQFEESLRPFTVTFKDGNDEVFSTQTVLYGEHATDPGRPTKKASDQFGFKFTGWDRTLKDITEDTIITAQFTPVDKYYAVVFYGWVNGVKMIVDQQQIEYGMSAIEPLPKLPSTGREDTQNVFTSWKLVSGTGYFDFVEDNMAFEPAYVTQDIKYKVTIINGNQTTVYDVKHGTVFNLPTPYKTNTNQIIYNFLSWQLNGETIQTVGKVYSDLTIEAIFEAVYNYYIVRFFDGNGRLIETQHVLRGDDIKTPSAVPTKNKTTDKVYVFTKWSRAFTDVESDLDIYAEFKEVDRYYTVTFYDANGQVISIQPNIEFGRNAIAPQAPNKLDTPMYRYEFIGWDTPHTNVQDNLDIRPVYEEITKTFEVIFKDGDGKIISTQHVEYGKSAIAPNEASKTPTDDLYYLFIGWNKSFDSVVENMVVDAQFDSVQRWYKVTFMGQNVLKEVVILIVQTVEYGKDATDPIRLIDINFVDDDFVWAIVGWQGDFEEVKEDRVITAEYALVPRYYEVIFQNYDGTELLRHEKVQYGSDAILPNETPIRESEDPNYRFEFTGWSEDVTFITKDLIAIAEYKQYSNVNIVKFIDGDGNELVSYEVYWNQDAPNPIDIGYMPTKEATKQYVYEFVGWDKPLTQVKEDRVITALFKEVERTYRVVFAYDDGKVIKEEHVKYGQSATAPDAALITLPEDTEEHKYSFIWSRQFKVISEDTLITLIVVEEKQEYTYIFYDADGKEYLKVTAPYGTPIEKPVPPTKNMTPQYVYTFVEWDNEIPVFLLENLEFRPIFDETVRTYTVTYYDGNGDIFGEVQIVPYGTNGMIPKEIPTKLSTKQYHYYFRMWNQKPENVKTDLIIDAVFNHELVEYEVTFVDENGLPFNRQLVKYGTGASEPENLPQKPPTYKEVYVFAGWDKSFNYITDDTIVQIRYVTVTRLYMYTFYDEDGITILKQIKGPYGTKIIPPAAPTKTSEDASFKYEFIGWDLPVADELTEDVSYVARYKIVKVKYFVYFYDGNGLVLDAQHIEHGSAAVSPSRIPTKEMTERYYYEFIGWDQSFDEVTQEMHIKPLFERKDRLFTITFNYDGNKQVKITKKYGESINLYTDPIPTAKRKGYSFDRWDKDLTNITQDIQTSPLFIPDRFTIYYYVMDIDGAQTVSEVVTFGQSTNVLPTQYSKLAYEFMGWKLDPQDDYVSYSAGDSFEYDLDDDLLLYAYFKPIDYSIIYDTDGGEILNPDVYNVENKPSILPTPTKEDYKFIGWQLVEVVQQDAASETSFARMSFRYLSAPKMMQATITTTEYFDVDDITYGWVKLIARYEFDGFIEIKEEYKETYKIAYAEITTIHDVEKRKKDDDMGPAYLFGIQLNQTLADLKDKIRNTNIEFIDSNGNSITDLTKVVATGYEVVIRDENNPSVYKDRVTMVLKGDVNGDGNVNVIDLGVITNHINKKSLVISNLMLLALLLNDDDTVDVIDLGVLTNHVNGKQKIYD